MALTQDDIQAIGQVIDQKLDTRLKPIGERLGTLEEKIQASKKDILAKLDQQAEDMAGFFHKTWELMEETNERVTALEEHVGIAHKN